MVYSSSDIVAPLCKGSSEQILSISLTEIYLKEKKNMRDCCSDNKGRRRNTANWSHAPFYVRQPVFVTKNFSLNFAPTEFRLLAWVRHTLSLANYAPGKETTPGLNSSLSASPAEGFITKTYEQEIRGETLKIGKKLKLICCCRRNSLRMWYKVGPISFDERQ